ncbi:DUF3298 and DUF4163 domain-containing protein [Brachyspira sp. G79]|uniref:DUF3298 and DUF4163 domain-containing protein n=1 Tax=Brachyspira sp. G79 TaxID=1358104 RepID=UPI000BBBCFD1|nr:DUF3298 and DUF4163 domain-containing protein [Brachyspira sp. G79]PCG19248.1 sulfurtransferase [Brachyspira sp. G79]
MKKSVIAIIFTLLILTSCSNSNNNQNSNNIQSDIDIPLTKNEKLYNYEVIYLMSDNGEYVSSALTYNTNNLGTIVYTESNQNSITFNVERIGELDEGNISAISYDNNTLEGNLPSISYPFNAKIDSKEIIFKSVKSPVTGARIIEYSYTNGSTNNDNIFEYKNSIFILNNKNNSEVIDKINLDINKEFDITDAASFNDLGSLLKKENVISNKMNAYYDEWVNSDYIANTSEDLSKYGINYLSEKFISINRFIYEYTGGAHGTYATVYSVYSLENGNKLKIEDLITDLKNTDLLNLIKDKLLKIEGRDERSYFDLNELSIENNNFYITSNGLVFTWGIYEIGPYAIGETKVLMSAEEIKPYLKDEYKTIFE